MDFLQRRSWLSEHDERNKAYAVAERPIVADLRAAGFDVDSVWDLGNRSGNADPAALPVLWSHMEKGGYPDRAMESLGSSMAIKEAVTYWHGLKRIYLSAQGPGEEEGAAEALAACATKAQFEDLVSLASDAQRGDARIHFLRPIKRLGRERGRPILEALRDDPALAAEVATLLR